MDDIEKEVKTTKEEKPIPKWKILKEYEKEIQAMIDNDIPIRKQIELIQKNGILEKLYYSEYYNILLRHFDYKKKRKTQRVFKPKSKENKKKVRMDGNNSTTRRSIDPVAELSKDVDLLDLA